MIFKIDLSIMQLNDPKLLLQFAKALQKISEHFHFLDVEYKVQQWIEDVVLSSDQYLGKLAVQEIKENRDMWSPSSMCKKYFRTVIIGCETGMITIPEMKILSEESSSVILENGKYDWCAISKWIKLYKKERSFGTINEYLNRVIGLHLIRSKNAGGVDGIPNEAENLILEYHGLHHLKVFSIFDSDRTSSIDTSDHHKALKDKLKDLGIDYHELNKREIENYFPLDVYSRAGFTINNADTPDLTDEEWDFVDVYNTPFLSLEKKNVEDLSSAITKPELQARVSVSAEPDEVQEIILKLAKYI